MDYFLILNGQKQGPFDLITIIKKIKNGVLVADTQVSQSVDGPFVPAGQHPDLAPLLSASQPDHENIINERKVELGLKKYFAEGVDLWSRYVVSFTLIVGAILTFSFFIGKAFDNFIDPEFSFIGNAVITLFAAFFYMVFFYIVLLAKRSQRPTPQEFIGSIKSSVGSLFIAALFMSLISLTSFFGIEISVLVWLGASLVLAYFVFVPFVIFDSGKKLGEAARLSFSKVAKAGSNNLGVILMLALFNVLLAFLPAFAAKDLMGFGLIISLPISVSAFAFVYDEIFG